MYWGLQSRAKKDLLHRLDAETYSSQDLIVFAVPMSLPYPLQQEGYERVDGEFEYQGEYYRLVKQRLDKDTLFMVCIKDQSKKKLVKVLNEYSNYANNLPVGADRTLDMFSKLFKDYAAGSLLYLTSDNGWSAPIQYGERQITLLGITQSVTSPPPRA